MMNDWLFNLYWAVARMGLGLGGVARDLDIPRTRCASRLEGTSET
jgi:hypothetical protein